TFFWYDGVVRASRSGARTPAAPDDVTLLPGAADALGRWRDEGRRLIGLAWQPEVERGTRTRAEVEATLARTHALLGVDVEALWCPHGDGPPVCWCRKPLPGLVVSALDRYALDPAACTYVGRDASDQALARATGLAFIHADDAF